MPEGDTIWRTAQTLDAALAGRVVTGFESPLPHVAEAAARCGILGQSVASVAAQGKHLLMHFESGATLHTHLGMRGTWHLYRVESEWRKPRFRARVVLRAGDLVAVCFSPMLAELVAPGELHRHPRLRLLGPDAARRDFDPAAARSRLRERDDLEIGVALLDQKALAGVGNVYKSEVLFLCHVNPFARVGSLPDATLESIARTAAAQLQRNLEGSERRTTSPLAPGRLWVYGRTGENCRRCGTRVRRAYQGEPRRATYWCARCQPAPPEPRGPDLAA